jgi:hypothetical protein
MGKALPFELEGKGKVGSLLQAVSYSLRNQKWGELFESKEGSTFGNEF